MIIKYSPDLKIQNLDALPVGIGAKYLECIAGEHGEYIAKQWRRKIPIITDTKFQYHGIFIEF